MGHHIHEGYIPFLQRWKIYVRFTLVNTLKHYPLAGSYSDLPAALVQVQRLLERFFSELVVVTRIDKVLLRIYIYIDNDH